MNDSHATPREPGATLPRHAICVFCGAKSGNDPKWVAAASQAGRVIARRGWAVVYGGGNVGLMGALADGALAAGGEVIGVIPRRLMERELAHRGLSRLEVVADMAERKTRMIQIADGFLSLPGGLGTLDELFEVLTLGQIGYHRKPSALFNQDGYWTPLLVACRGMVEAGFVLPADLDALHDAATIEGALDHLAAR